MDGRVLRLLGNARREVVTGGCHHYSPTHVGPDKDLPVTHHVTVDEMPPRDRASYQDAMASIMQQRCVCRGEHLAWRIVLSITLVPFPPPPPPPRRRFEAVDGLPDVSGGSFRVQAAGPKLVLYVLDCSTGRLAVRILPACACRHF